MVRYIVTGIVVTGTPGSPQTISYADLTDENGVTLPAAFDASPSINIIDKSLDVPVYKTELPGTTSFKIVRGYGGVMGGTLTVDIEIIYYPPVPEPTAGENAWTLTDMMNMLNILLNDSEKQEFPPALKVRMLNSAQYRTIKKLKPNILKELYEKATALSLDSKAAYDITNLTYEVLDGSNGIDRVKITDGEICDRITSDECRELAIADHNFSLTEPMYCIEGKYLYLCAGSASSSQTIEISYWRKPVAMALAADPANNVDCELADNLHEVIVGIACENYKNRTPEAFEAYNNAMIMIDKLNEEHSDSDSVKFARLHGTAVDIYERGISNIYTNR